MNQIRIYDPALCCATGVCGVDLDQELVRVSADIHWARAQGGDVARYNLASEPAEFAARDTVRAFLEVAGSAGLPLVLVDDVTVLTGRYPTRSELATWAGVPIDRARVALSVVEAAPAAGGCCAAPTGASDASAPAASGCCS